MNIDSTVIRLALDASNNIPPQDVNKATQPSLWIGTNVKFQIGIFFDDTLVDDISNLDSITVMVKDPANKSGDALMSKTVPSAYFDPTLTQETWDDGTKQHAVITFDETETVLPVETDSTSFWLSISSVINTGVSVICQSLVRSGGTVTFTSVGAHGLTDGQQVTIAGATPSDYNGVFTITVTGTTTFTYPIGTTPGSATGSITAAATVARSIVLGGGAISALNSGHTIATPASVTSPTYFTAAQSDARYVMAIDLTTITNNTALALSTANSAAADAATAISTVAAAMPKAGGTFSGAVTFSGTNTLTLKSSDPSGTWDAAPKHYVDTKALLLTGGTVTGGAVFSGGVSANTLSVGTLAGIIMGSAGVLGVATIGTPLVFSSGTLSINRATASVDGYLRATDFGVFFNKQDTLDVEAGTPITIPDGFTLTMHAADASHDGYLNQTDWATFNDKVDKAGSTMTGALVLSGAPTLSLHAATKAYADLMLPLAGGTLTGTLTLSSGNINLATGVYKVAGTQVLGAQQASIADPSAISAASGADIANAADLANTQDLQAKVLLILDALQAHGIIAT